MFGESPIAIPLSFENTKYPSMEDKMKTLMQNREEALAAHKLARSCMADRRQSTFIPLVSLQEPEDNLSQENETKTGRAFGNY